VESDTNVISDGTEIDFRPSRAAVNSMRLEVVPTAHPCISTRVDG
jgi:hypothetical protein